VDNGGGIPEDVLPRIFDPFFTTKPVGQGTGLGLEIAMRLVRRQQGDLTVESRPGRTVFRVSLPIPADATPAVS
ncbi:MAG TPA: ATP-binding protein, partial [Gemmatimonadaceae bacterium]|nr:ATP-binding protein [Gemmatimonadaceae bacterium]